MSLTQNNSRFLLLVNSGVMGGSFLFIMGVLCSSGIHFFGSIGRILGSRDYLYPGRGYLHWAIFIISVAFSFTLGRNFVYTGSLSCSRVCSFHPGRCLGSGP
jgi:hypothetical protein